jgi:hypothetical protein
MGKKKNPNEKTFTEANGRKPFDWNAFLNQKHFTLAEMRIAQAKAESWVTCACGMQCAAIPRHPKGMPMDLHLADLGEHFMDHINNMAGASNGHLRSLHQQKAKDVLAKIETRAAELIREVGDE